jgi:threonine dehydratase
MTLMQRPTFSDVLAAKATIAPYLPRTPLLSYPLLDNLLGATAYVKREDCQPTCAFKVRGASTFSQTSPRRSDREA